jgi:geranylgeranyl pyrophosphate synthase
MDSNYMEVDCANHIMSTSSKKAIESMHGNDPWQTAKKNLKSVESLMCSYVSVPGALGDAARYHLSTGGKRMRPLLSLAVGASLGCDVDSMKRLSAAIEFLHNASLVHDDLQDHDQYRRGVETVWSRFGPEMAINLGDFFITTSFLALADIGGNSDIVTKLVSLFAESTRKVIGGQSAEVEATRSADINLQDYIQIARGKSGVLMALPVLSALTVARAENDVMHEARQAMEWLGVAYQIQDDVSDILGLKNGRPAGVDIREGKYTLPVIHYLDQSRLDVRQEFERFLSSTKSQTQEEVNYWVDRLRLSPAIEQSWFAFTTAAEKATRHIEMLPHNLRVTLNEGKNMLFAANEDQIQEALYDSNMEIVVS